MEADKGRLSFEVGLDVQKLQDDVNKVKQELHSIGQTAEKEGNTIDKAMKSITTSATLLFSAAQLKDFAMHIANVRGQFQQLEIAFSTMLGSKAQADALMGQLIKTAAITPFGMSDVANGAKQLLAFGVEAKDVNETLTRLGDIAAGLSIPLNDLIYLYGTTMTQGRMFTQDLRQFMSRGIPLADELAKQFGVAKNQVGELVTAGKVGAKEVQEAIWAMTNEGSKFGGLMEAQSKSITGQISNIEDSIEQMFNSIGKSSEGAITGMLDGVSVAVEHWQDIAKVIGVVITAYGAYKGAILASIAISKLKQMVTRETAAAELLLAVSGKTATSANIAMAVATNGATTAMQGLKAAVMSNPLGLIAGIIATAVSAFVAFGDSAENAAEMSERFGKSATKATAEVESLYSIMNVSSDGSKVQKDAMSDLIKVMEDYGIKVDKEKATTEELNALHAQLTETIRQESIERERANAIDTFNTKYTDSVKAAVEEARESLSGIRGGDAIVQVGFSQLVDKEQLKEYNKLLQEFYAARDANLRERSEESRKLFTEAHNRLVAYDKELEKNLHNILKRAGVTEYGHIREAEKAFWAYRNSINEANVELDANVAVANDAATAAQELSSATDAMTAEQRLAAKQMQILKDHSHDLRSYLDNLARTYKITIDFEQTNVPSWMSGINAKKSKEMAAFYSAAAEQNLKAGRKGSNVRQSDGSLKFMSNEEMMQRAGGYAKNADAKDAETKKKEQEAPQKKTKKKSGKSDAEKAKEKAEEERKRIAEQTEERLQSIKEYSQRVSDEAERAELEIRQRKIEAMEEGYEKERAQLILNYDRLRAENQERQQKMLEALADNKVNEWLNKNPKATKQEQTAYRNSLLDKQSQSRLTDNDLTKDQREQLQAYEAITQQIRLKQEQELYKRLLDTHQDYETRRQLTHEKYTKERQSFERLLLSDEKQKFTLIAGYEQLSAEERATAWQEYSRRVVGAIEEVEKKHKAEIKAINNEELEQAQKSSSLLIDLFSDFSGKSSRELKKILAETKELLDYLSTTTAGNITPNFGFTAEQLRTLKESPEKLKAIKDGYEKLKESTKSGNPFSDLVESIKDLFTTPKDGEEGKSTEAKIKQLGESASETSRIVGDFAGQLAEMFEAAGNESMAQAMSDVQMFASTISNIAEGFAKGGVAGGIMAGIGAAMDFATKAFAAAARHKAALKEIMKEATAQQRAYTLAIIEQNMALKEASTIFGDLDYKRASNAVNVMSQTWAKLSNEIKGTAELQKKYEKSWSFGGIGKLIKPIRYEYSALKHAYAGLADIVIKTGHKKTGLFGWGKGKDTFSSILDVYPQLLDKQGKFNTELAKSIISSRTFKGEGKEALQHMISLAEKADEAYNGVKDYLKGIFGELGNTMSDALVDAFRNGTDAAEAFGKSVSSMLEKIGAQMIYSTLFSGIVEKANNEMLATMTNLSLTEEQKFKQYVATLDTMTSGILSQQGTYNSLMEKYQAIAKNKGIDLYQTSDDHQRQASQKGIATASQDSIDELNGRMTAVQSHTYSINEHTKQLLTTSNLILKSVINIESETQGFGRRLERMEGSLKAVNDSLTTITSKGIKIA